MVASGGCTAAVLATMPNVAAIHLVDANPAQLALARLKLRLLERRSHFGGGCISVTSRLKYDERQEWLAAELQRLELPAISSERRNWSPRSARTTPAATSNVSQRSRSNSPHNAADGAAIFTRSSHSPITPNKPVVLLPIHRSAGVWTKPSIRR